MSLARLDIPTLLRKHGLHAKKGLGQNFLLDEDVLRQITACAEIPAGATVLEIGPGLGNLTRHLARAARRVVAVELDGALLPVLDEVLKGYTNVSGVQGDILQIDLARLDLEPGYQVVANIPYYITSAVIRRLLEAPVQPSRITLTVQKEVAQRLCALPGELSLLALSVQVYGQPRLALTVPAEAFYPAPTVDSAVVRIDLYPQPRIPAGHLDVFFTLIKAGFSQKRKTLRNALSGGLAWPPEKAAALLQSAAIDPQRRAETISIEEWGVLVESFAGFKK